MRHVGLMKNRGFTLIELSIVIVIIGLIIGGVLVGRDLINAAAVRAQLAQIDKFNSAVNAFKSKFGYLPGDMTNTAAQQYGFTVGTSCSGAQGWRDGNGLVEGWASPITFVEGAGETALFWQDISSAAAGNLIEGQFPNGGAAAFGCVGGAAAAVSGSAVGQIFPAAKIGNGQFIYVYSANNINWYGLSAVTSNTSNGYLNSNASLPVMQAYNMDKKVDDGMPTTGEIQAIYLNNSTSAYQNAPNAATDGATTCYSTNNSIYSYSIGYSNGRMSTCAISFRFQ